jgi:iron complex transport system permease protein
MTRVALTYVVLLVLLGATTGTSLLVGQGSLGDAGLRGTLLELRALRIEASFLSGAALAAAGVVVQGLFRNPLVSPSILGATAGASLGGQTALLAFVAFPAVAQLSPLASALLVPLGCLAGALVELLVLLAFCRERSETLTLILTGFILSALFLSLGGLVTSLSQDSWELGRAVVSFTLGGVGGVGQRQIALALPLVVAGIVAAFFWGRALDLLLSGEEEAGSLGLDVATTRRFCIVWVSVLTGAAVSLGGSVAFVGLIAPHALRPFVGVLHRRLVPAAALLGGTFLVACDTLARLLPTRTEIPLGVVTGLIGGPLFLHLLLRERRRLAHG